MAKREDLEWLLRFVSEIVKDSENDWFLKSLREQLSTGSGVTEEIFVGLAKDVEAMRAYLMIDVVPLINYEEIENETVKAQLKRDCIEMGKYRLGKINDRIKFDEFCRYGHLQAEELVNYFFVKKFITLDAITQALEAFNDRFRSDRKQLNLNAISYFYKLIALKNITNLDSFTYGTLYALNELRNEMSHRNSTSVKNEERIMDAFTLKGYKENQFFDYSKASPKDAKIFNDGRFVIFKRKEDFHSIYIALENLKTRVIAAIKEPLDYSDKIVEAPLSEGKALDDLKKKFHS